MAYRRKRTTRRRASTTRRTSSYRPRARRSTTTRRRATATRRRSAPQVVRIVVQSDPNPQLAGTALGQTVSSVRETAPTQRARF